MCVASAAVLISSLTGCGSAARPSRFFVNDRSRSAYVVTEKVLVPGVPFSTQQNELLHQSDTSGRDYYLLFGPYPRLAGTSTITVRNPDLTVVVEDTPFFGVVTGTKPTAVVKSVRTFSEGTEYILCSVGDKVAVFCESSHTGRPVVLESDNPTGFPLPRTEVSTGQYATVDRAGAVAVRKYFEPSHPEAIDPTLPAELVEALTYARGRSQAAGLIPQGKFYLGRFDKGIPPADESNPPARSR
jgi:hypothetical protein